MAPRIFSRTSVEFLVLLNTSNAVFVSRHERYPRSCEIASSNDFGPFQNLHSAMNIFLFSALIRMSVLPDALNVSPVALPS